MPERTHSSTQRTTTQRIEEIAERIAASEGMELVEVEFLGGGKSRLLRVTIDKPGGVSHQDCETMSRQLGTILDVEEAIPGGRYNLEITSPGVERKLFRPRDFERFTGERVKLSLKQPRDGRKTFEGLLTGYREGRISLEVAAGQTLDLALNDIAKANLKFDWTKAGVR